MANLMVEKLTERCLIEPVREKCALIGFKMHPLIQPIVVGRAEEDGFFKFDSHGNPSVQLSVSNRACLVTGNDQRRSRDELANTQDDANLKRLQTLFNINESYPDFKLDMFLKLRNLKVLSLGRWQSSSDHHIELESTEFLKGLKFMESLRYFSLRGVSRIFELPDAVCKLSSLRILDLNACHNLEVLPEAMGSLKKLISLDISECYLLDKMPKSLAMLTELRILKGFLITSEGCSFNELDELKKLIKLSVNVSRDNFPNTEDFHTFQNFELLQKLTISWGGKSISSTSTTRDEVKKPLRKILSKVLTVKPQNDQPEVPENCFKSLNKLSLQCYPQEQVWWLKPHHFNKLNKLCIQGGKLQKLPEPQSGNCWTKVESLHLNFLPDLQISSMDLEGSFPKLTYLEVVGCDKLAKFDYDESWLNKHPCAYKIKSDGKSEVVEGSIWLN